MKRPWEHQSQGTNGSTPTNWSPDQKAVLAGEDEHECPKFECQLCGYSGQPTVGICTCDGEPCREVEQRPGCRAGAPGCPICLDGGIDPWALVRRIRSLIHPDLSSRGRRGSRLDPALVDRLLSHGDRDLSSEAGDEAPDLFLSEWDLLRLSIIAIWTDLTPSELQWVDGDRIRFEGLLRQRYGYGTALAHQLTDGLLDLHEHFNGKWEVVGECVPRHWPEITEQDVETMRGTMGELAGLVERRYALARGRGRLEVIDFLYQIDYPLLIRLFRTGAADSVIGEAEHTRPVAESKGGD